MKKTLSVAVIDLTSTLIVGALTILAVLVRMEDCSKWWLNPDEGIYYSVAIQPSLARLVAGTVAHVHPPLYYMFLWSLAHWTHDFQNLRLLSILCGSLCVPATFVLSLTATNNNAATKSTYGNTATNLLLSWRHLIAIACATLVALSPACITLSSVLRPYSLLLLLSLLSIIGALKGCRENSSRWILLYQITISMALLTHYSAVLVMVLLAPCWPSRRAWWAANRDVLIVLGLVFAINLQFVLQRPVVWNFRKKYLGNQFINSPYALVRLTGELFIYNSTNYLGISMAILWLLSIAGECIGPRTPLNRVVITSFLLPVLLSIAGAYPFGGSRHTHYLIPFLLLGITSGLWKRPVFGGIFIATLALASFSPVVNQISPLATHPISEERTLPAHDLDEMQSIISGMDWNNSNLVVDEQTRFTLGPWIKEKLLSIIPKERIYFLKDHWVLGIASPLREEIQSMVPVKNPTDEWYVLISGWNTDKAFAAEGKEPRFIGLFNIGTRSPAPDVEENKKR